MSADGGQGLWRVENSTEKASVFGLLLKMSWNRDIDGGDGLVGGGCVWWMPLFTLFADFAYFGHDNVFGLRRRVG